VGWSIDSNPTAALVTNALGMAIEQRGPPDGKTVIHSDQGTQFTPWAFTQRAVDSGLLPSMGSVGDCYDNAMIESFWSRMQVELLDRKRWKTRVELSNAIFEYLEIFHNRQRRHSSLGMLTPVEYELQNASPAEYPGRFRFCLMTIRQRDNQNYEKSCDNCTTTPTNIEFQK
jgi:transposase InsO family protein